MLNSFDLTSALRYVDNTNGSQTLICIALAIGVIGSIIWMALKTSEILALLCAGAIGFVAYSLGTSWFMDQPVWMLLVADATLVALTYFLPERAKRSIYV